MSWVRSGDRCGGRCRLAEHSKIVVQVEASRVCCLGLPSPAVFRQQRPMCPGSHPVHQWSQVIRSVRRWSSRAFARKSGYATTRCRDGTRSGSADNGLRSCPVINARLSALGRPPAARLVVAVALVIALAACAGHSTPTPFQTQSKAKEQAFRTQMEQALQRAPLRIAAASQCPFGIGCWSTALNPGRAALRIQAVFHAARFRSAIECGDPVRYCVVTARAGTVPLLVVRIARRHAGHSTSITRWRRLKSGSLVYDNPID